MRTTIWDVLTVCIVVGIIGIVGIFGLIFLNPYVPFNPFPPPFIPVDTSNLLLTLAPSGSVFPAPVTPTYTSTSRLGPTWTENPLEKATSTIRPSATLTPTITGTATISRTPTISLTPTATYTITGTPPTATPSRTLTGTTTKTRLPTMTYNPAAGTSAAKTAFAAQTNEARIQKTENAQKTKDAYNLSLTQTALSIQRTNDASSAQKTQNALKLTQTAQAINKTEDLLDEHKTQTAQAINKTEDLLDEHKTETAQAVKKTEDYANQQKTQTAQAVQKTENISNQQLTESAYSKTQTATAAVKQTQDAYNQRLTLVAQQKTQTAAPNQTYAAVQTQQQQTAVVKTADANATETAVQATANATATLVARATEIVIAPIAYGVDTDLGGPPYDYEEIGITRIIGGTGFPIILDLTADDFDDVDSIGSWWLDDTEDLWYVLFSESTQSTPLYRILYTNETVHSVLTSPAGANAMPIVNIQSGAASSRWVVFTRFQGGVRDLWRMRGDGSVAQALTNSPSLSTWDEHDPSWTPNGDIIYATGDVAGADNIYVITPGDTPPGSAMTAYTGIVEIDSPKWCRGWDWEAGENKDRVVFARRAGPGDDWDLYFADPNDWDNTFIQLTDTDGIDELNPSWSSYCDRIIYVSNGAGEYDIWHMAWDASDFDASYADVTNRLTDDANVEHNPIWRPTE